MGKKGKKVGKAVKKAGKGVKKTAKKVGKAVKKTAKKVGKAVKKTAKKIGKAVKKVGKVISKGLSKAWNALAFHRAFECLKTKSPCAKFKRAMKRGGFKKFPCTDEARCTCEQKQEFCKTPKHKKRNKMFPSTQALKQKE